MCIGMYSFIHSKIYIAPLLQCGQKDRFSNKKTIGTPQSREQAQLLREIIPNPRARHRECAVLHRRCTGQRDHQNTLSAERRDRLPWAPTLADRDLVDKLVQGQVGTAKPERRLYTECAAGQEANAEHLTYIW